MAKAVVMDLILWRHAEARELPEDVPFDPVADLARPLTPRGDKQAAHGRVAEPLFA